MGGLRGIAALGVALLLGASCTLDEGNATLQGWSARNQSDWYAATQGSRLIPWAWARALERPGEPGKFFDAAWLTRFRLLPRGPGELPVGFAIDQQDDRALTVTKLRWTANQPNDAQWLGFNCAACHTAEITHKGERLRIDGGPGLTDFQSLTEAVDAALIETRADPAKWDRFAVAVLGGAPDAAARDRLAGEVDKLIAWNKKIEKANATPLRPGYARVDAFGHIYNKVALLAGPDTPAPNPADAPVSYPFLWNTHQADRVQWNGIAENKRLAGFDYGALGRNSGEVIGVYGDVAILPDRGLGGYKSSLQIESINALERVLALLQPPAWPNQLLGAPDAALVEKGKALFGKSCGGACHGALARDDLKTRFTTRVFKLRGPGAPGTDPWMACNAVTYEARTGAMAKLPSGYLDLPGGTPAPRLGEVAPVANMLRTAVVGSLVGAKFDAIKAAGATWLGVPPRPLVIEPGVRDLGESKPARLARCLAATDKEDPRGIIGYRARPLTGIWATAPYLHNGSVPTLWDLLLPPDQRPAEFFVGSREYDPVKVGYVTAQSAENSFRFVARDAGGFVAGNGNGGHDYGNARFSDEDRRALVEYMKTL